LSLRHDAWRACPGHRFRRIKLLPTDVTVRLATLADVSEIADMSRALIETGLGWTWTRERVGRNIASPNTVTVVACDLERVVGFAIMYFGDDHAHLSLLAVRRSYQHTGIGRHLVRWLEESALVAGIATIRLELRAGNRAARRFYERLGFAEVGRIPDYYAGVETAVRMARDIRRAQSGPLPDVRSLLR